MDDDEYDFYEKAYTYKGLNDFTLEVIERMMKPTPEYTLSNFEWVKETNLLISKVGIRGDKVRIIGENITKTFNYVGMMDGSYLYISECKKFKMTCENLDG